MDVKIYPSRLEGEAIAVSSKTMAHRAFIISALCEDGARVKVRGLTPDVEITVRCLNSLGFKTEVKEGVYSVLYEPETETSTVDFEDSTATFKMLLPIIAYLGKHCKLTGKEKAFKNTENLRAMLKGCSFDREIFPFRINGKLQAGEYNLKETAGSQFVSGLMMALPLLDGDSKLLITPEGQTLQFLNMTVDLIKEFGVEIERTDYGYFIRGGQKYFYDGCFEIEGDYTNSAYFMTANLFGNSVKVKGLSDKTYQIDKKIIDIIDSISKKKKVIDVKDNAEIVPAIAVALCYQNHETLLKNVQKVKLKETDRNSVLIANLNKLGGNAMEVEDGILIKGVGGLKGGVMVDTFGDRRIAMAMAFASTFAEESVTVLNVQSVNKVYPNFFNDFMKMGGKCSVL